MKKSKEKLQTLLLNYLDGSISAEDQKELWAYALSPEYDQQFLETLPDAFDADLPIQEPGLMPLQRQSILRYIFHFLPSENNVRKNKLWPSLLAAAILLIVFGTALFTYLTPENQKRLGEEDVAAGENTATLFLSDGAKIRLSDLSSGKVAEQNGALIEMNEKGELVYKVINAAVENNTTYNSLLTARGEQYMVHLPDGTKVWLNADSKISFPSRFIGRTRRVTLSGEAFFEVAKNKEMPFIVKTNGQLVEVLGTQFNISAYEEENSVKTTLLEGVVRLLPEYPGKGFFPGGSAEVILKPNQQAVMTGSKPIIIKSVDATVAVDWKNNEINFGNDDFKTVMRKIGRWYDVAIVYDASAPDDIQLGGWVSRKSNLSAVLNWIASTHKVHFKIEGRKVIVTK